ncbi:MFS transporter [Hyphomonas sp.]|jgi:predicted MFS family arabinose efflux permease|uniref:spinster family MFS transporter n=1 Tax=Hyphomonas sp. TaxID=87 RepID=UPI000ADCC942|nr:MFS transporter [Hyphomonas sp.]MBA4339536.1 MFS transporter [Hyphomonas sp.]
MTSTTLPTSAPNISGRAWVLAVLTLTYTFNHVDRQILVILLEPIKAEFGLSDGQVGWLTGLSFAAFYATLGIPVAMWADRGNRRNIISLALALWSAMTALSGLAQNFWHLLLARMGVGVGEAGGTPPATSMIADLYPPQERAMALGIYTSGIGLGIMAGFALGGYIYELYGWRAAFFAAGIPGLILALIVRFGIKEPVRGLADQRRDDGPAPSLGETLRFIFSQSSYLWLLAGCLLICISANAFLVFTSSHLQRTYSLTPGEVSLPLGILIGGVGSLGAVVLGRVCDVLSKRDLRWRPLIIAIGAGIALPFAWMFLRAPTVETAYAWNIVPSFIGLIYASVAYTASQELVKLRMRSFASAFMLFCLTLIGIGCGPLIAGMLSDHFSAQGAAQPLARSLEMILAFNAASIVCLLMATRNYRRDVARAAG